MEIDWNKAICTSERLEYHPTSIKRDHIVHALYNNKEAMLPTLHMLYGMSEESLTALREEQRKEMIEGSSFALDVLDKRTGELVAGSGFRYFNGSKAHWKIVVEPKWRRKGFASEIFTTSVKLAKEVLRCTHIETQTLPINHVMLNFLRKRGLKELERVDGDEWIRFEAPIEIIETALTVL